MNWWRRSCVCLWKSAASRSSRIQPDQYVKHPLLPLRSLALWMSVVLILIALCTQMVLPLGRGRSVHACPSPKSWFHTLRRRHVLYTGPSILLVLLVLLSHHLETDDLCSRARPARTYQKPDQTASYWCFYFIQPIYLLGPNIQILQQNYAVAVQDAALTLANFAGTFLTSCSKTVWVLYRTKHRHRKGSLTGVFFMSSFDKTMPCRRWHSHSKSSLTVVI
jgi:hypothetical protein